MDVEVMLFVGFGFLMTFLRRFGYSAVCFTMLITVMCVEYAVIVKGLTYDYQLTKEIREGKKSFKFLI